VETKDAAKGTFINLDAPDGDWFSFFSSHIDANGQTVYDEPLPGAGRVCIRSIAPIVEEQQQRRKKKTEFVLNPQTRSMERVSFFEDPTPEEAKAKRDELIDFMIVDIENFLDGKGDAIPCTKENKVKLMFIPVFDRFVARCNELLREAGIKSAEEAEKNL
jgi:hypothetical protein